MVTAFHDISIFYKCVYEYREVATSALVCQVGLTTVILTTFPFIKSTVGQQLQIPEGTVTVSVLRKRNDTPIGNLLLFKPLWTSGFCTFVCFS